MKMYSLAQLILRPRMLSPMVFTPPLLTVLCIALSSMALPHSALASPAAPPQERNSEKHSETPLIGVKGDLTLRFTSASIASQEVNAFEMQRTELGISTRDSSDLRGEIVLEAIRSAGTRSFSGIDGDSLLLRLKRAWAGLREQIGPLTIQGNAGLVPTPWIANAERESQIRFLEKLASERLGMYSSSDIGVSLDVSALRGAIELHAALLNGEGAHQLERNNGKNSQFLLSATLASRTIASKPWHLRLHVGGQEGSLGPSAAASHRLSAGISSLHPRLAMGAEVHYAYGVADVSSRRSRVLGLWMRTNWHSLQLIARYDQHRADLNRSQTTSHLLLAGLFAQRSTGSTLLRIGLVARIERADSNASPIPGLSSAASQSAALLVVSAHLGEPR